MVRFPVKIDEEGGESRLNVTSLEIPSITYFDRDIKRRLREPFGSALQCYHTSSA